MSKFKKKIIRCCTVAQSLGFVEEMMDDFREQGYEVVLLSSPGDEMDKLEAEHGCKCCRVPMQRHISPLKDLKSLWQVFRVFRREKPDMIHSMTPKAGLLCMLAGWLAGVPRRVHTFTGLVWPTTKGLKRRILMFTDWITCACATHIVPEGEGVKADLEQHITHKPMKVLGYGNVKGVNMERYSLRPEIVELAQELRKRDVFTFLFVGRMVGDKGVNELVDAFGRLHTQNPHCRLVLVGKMEENLDPLKPSTLKKILALNGILAVGAKYADELIAWYAAADCFVLPSYREGFPNTVLEAGAMGLPCIVTDINGSREIVEDGKNGLVIPSKDASALYEAMLRMVQDDDLRQALVANARAMIADRFEESFVKKCLLDFYHDIL